MSAESAKPNRYLKRAKPQAWMFAPLMGEFADVMLDVHNRLKRHIYDPHGEGLEQKIVELRTRLESMTRELTRT